MTIRGDIESRLLSFAAAQTPPIPVALEGVPLTRPTNSTFYFELFFLPSTTTTVTLGARHIRQRGMVQINVWTVDGHGSGALEAMADQVAALYPVVPITQNTIITKYPATGVQRQDSTWRCIPVYVSYRQEQIL